MKILVESSGLSNIGDGFYQSALLELIRHEFPDWDVYALESPIWRTFKMTRQWHRTNAFPLMNFQEGDIYIFSGPMLSQLITHYRILIESLMNRGSRYALVSCSCGADFPRELRKKIGAFLKRFPPIAFSTRDPESFDQLSEYVDYPYNGICTAFLVNEYLKVDTPILNRPYFVSSFYTMLEPKFESSHSELTADSLIVSKKYTLPWKCLHRYVRHFEWLLKKPEFLCGMKIIRTHHGINYSYPHRNFGAPNSYLSQNPVTFLSIYKGSEFTVSDRVHACVVSLAFGKPAILIGENSRTGVFRRFGLDCSSGTVMRLETGRIMYEKSKLIEYLKECFGGFKLTTKVCVTSSLEKTFNDFRKDSIRMT